MKTVLNPDEVRRFADWLEEQSANVMLDLRDTSIAMLELQTSWNDAKFDTYTNLFESNTKLLAEFTQDVERFVSYLRKKADNTSDYLG